MIIAREMSATPLPGHPFQIVCHLSDDLENGFYPFEILSNIIFDKQLTTGERLQ